MRYQKMRAGGGRETIILQVMALVEYPELSLKGQLEINMGSHTLIIATT